MLELIRHEATELSSFPSLSRPSCCKQIIINKLLIITYTLYIAMRSGNRLEGDIFFNHGGIRYVHDPPLFRALKLYYADLSKASFLPEHILYTGLRLCDYVYPLAFIRKASALVYSHERLRAFPRVTALPLSLFVYTADNNIIYLANENSVRQNYITVFFSFFFSESERRETQALTYVYMRGGL